MPDAAPEPGSSRSEPPASSLVNSRRTEASCCRAVRRARSTEDFVSKLGIVLEEADDSLFWIDLLVENGAARHAKVASVRQAANELVAIFVASLRTARGLKSAI